MAEVGEAQVETVKRVKHKECQHCAEEIKRSAKVCRYCSRVQLGFAKSFNYIRPAEILSVILSVSLLGFSIAQFRRADLQLTQAREANIKAQEALVKANEAVSKAESALQKTSETEGRVLEARRDVFDVAQAVIEVAEILPRAGQLGGLDNLDRARLMKHIEFFKSKLSKYKQ